MDKCSEHCTMFKNGNINIRFKDAKEREDIGDARFVELLLEELYFIDVYAIGEPFSMGNFTMGQTLYNLGTCQCYTLDLGGDIEALKEGTRVKLYARTPDESDRDLIGEAFGFDVHENRKGA